MLNEILTRDSIVFKKSCPDWQTAVRESCAPLLARGTIEAAYIDAIIANVLELGPYIVIAPDVAIPHARPEAGSLAMGMSLLKLQEPVAFGDAPDEQARMLFAFSAVDSSSHQRALKQLADLIMDEEKFAAFAAADSVDAILAIINSVSK
jgi:mannitol/fructose-specific phosphotransferase system IIA component (Ntr-type)